VVKDFHHKAIKEQYTLESQRSEEDEMIVSEPEQKIREAIDQLYLQ